MRYNQLVVLLLSLLSLGILSPSRIQANQTPVSPAMVLHGPPVDVTSLNQVVWNGTLPLYTSQDKVILQYHPALKVRTEPVSHVAMTGVTAGSPQSLESWLNRLATLESVVRSQQASLNTLSRARPGSTTSDTYLSVAPPSFAAYLNYFQGAPPLVFQGSSTTNYLLHIAVTQPTNTTVLTIPQLTQDGTIVIDNLAQTLTNKTISGAHNTITQLPNSALDNPWVRLSGGTGIKIKDGEVQLGETAVIELDQNALASLATSIDTLASVTARGANTTTQVILSNATNIIQAGVLTATGGTLDGVAIGLINPGIGQFTSVNGLNILNHGGNVLDIATGKTLQVGNSLGLTGTDGTTFQLPSLSDTLVGIDSVATLTNKTLTAPIMTNPTLNGIISSSGLTLPDLTLSGTLSGLGAAEITGLNRINGLHLTDHVNSILSIGDNKTVTIGNSLTLAGTDGTTLTFPTLSDYVVGRNTVETLSNKTLLAPTLTSALLTDPTLTSAVLSAPSLESAVLSSPVLSSPVLSEATINGIVNTTGLTLPSFAVTGPISGSGLASLTDFAAINGLTIANDGPRTLSIAAGKTLGVTNSVTFSGTDDTTITLPGVSDTLVGRNTVDTLLNKTLTAPILSAPAINGVVTTTGLTLPAFTAGGTITGSGSPIMTGFGAINGLSLSSSTIEPAEPGNLTVRAHGTHTLTLDTGVGGAISLGSANASGLNVGHSSSTFTLSGNFDQSGSSGSFKTGSGAITLNGDTTLASGKSLIITTADNLLVGGSKVLQTIPIRVPLTALIANQTIFIADATYQLSDVKCLPSALSLSGSMQVTVDTGTGGVGSGINQLTSSLSLSGLINTVVSGNLISTPTLIQPGDRVSVTFGGILTGLTGNCMVYVKRV